MRRYSVVTTRASVRRALIALIWTVITAVFLVSPLHSHELQSPGAGSNGGNSGLPGIVGRIIAVPSNTNITIEDRKGTVFHVNLKSPTLFKKKVAGGDQNAKPEEFKAGSLVWVWGTPKGDVVETHYLLLLKGAEKN